MKIAGNTFLWAANLRNRRRCNLLFWKTHIHLEDGEKYSFKIAVTKAAKCLFDPEHVVKIVIKCIIKTTTTIITRKGRKGGEDLFSEKNVINSGTKQYHRGQNTHVNPQMSQYV